MSTGVSAGPGFDCRPRQTKDAIVGSRSSPAWHSLYGESVEGCGYNSDSALKSGNKGPNKSNQSSRLNENLFLWR